MTLAERFAYLVTFAVCVAALVFTLTYKNKIDGQYTVVSKEYDALYADYMELHEEHTAALKVIALSPWLEDEWKMKNTQ